MRLERERLESDLESSNHLLQKLGADLSDRDAQLAGLRPWASSVAPGNSEQSRLKSSGSHAGTIPNRELPEGITDMAVKS